MSEPFPPHRMPPMPRPAMGTTASPGDEHDEPGARSWGGPGLLQQVPAGPARAYLKLPDIAGESRAAGHEDEIDVHGVEWGLHQAAASTGRRRGRVVGDDVVVTARFDASSPYLMSAMARGRVLREAVLSWVQDSGDGADVARVVLALDNVVVTSWRALSIASMPAVRVTLSYEALRLSYVEVGADGGAGAEHEVEFDLAAQA